MSTISIDDIQRDPQSFLARIEAGESLVVVRDAHPVAEVRPVPRWLEEPRPCGLAAGEFEVPADFDDPLPDEILKAFFGQ